MEQQHSRRESVRVGTESQALLLELNKQPPVPSTAGLEASWPTEVGWHCAVMPTRDATAIKMEAEFTAVIAAVLHGCLEVQAVLQLSPALARNQPDERVEVSTAHDLPLFVGEL